MPVKRADIHWLVGLLEGEGCFHRTRCGRLQVRLKMADKDVVARAGCLLGRRPTRCAPDKRSATWKRLWLVTVTGTSARKWMQRLAPFMGLRRQKQIRKCLS
jgi:hypothetical protein